MTVVAPASCCGHGHGAQGQSCIHYTTLRVSCCKYSTGRAGCVDGLPGRPHLAGSRGDVPDGGSRRFALNDAVLGVTAVTCGHVEVGRGIAADSTAIWLGRACARACAPPDFGWVWRIDPVSYKRSRPIVNVPSDRLAFGGGELWAYGANGFRVARIDSRGHLSRYAVPDYVSASYNQPGIAIAFGATWIVSPDASPGSALFEYTSSGFQRSLRVPPGAYEVVAGDNSLWVLGSSGTVTKVNPYTSHVGPTYRLHHAAQGIAYFDHRIWITVGQATSAG